LHRPAGRAGSAGLLSPEHFDVIRRLAMRHAGLALADHKRSLVHRRVCKRLAALGLDSFAAYCALLTGAEGATEMQPLINALTTNRTEFFREKHHFDHLAGTAIPRLIKSAAAGGPRRLRIWSAGCSSGPEPYSIAMTLRDRMADLPRWDAKILATDIDTDILDQARRGLYRTEEIGAVPAAYRARFLEPEAGVPRQYRVAASVRSLVVFKPLNVHDRWPMKGIFDAIFCRNVVIYFDKPTQARLFDRFADVLREDGFLYLGHSESLYRVSDRFRPVGQSIYRKIA
jgi:chemotaxis protein methyltransferase CheR